MQIVWSNAALRDLAVIRNHIAADNPPAADRQFQLIFSAVARLADFPLSGRGGRIAGTRELVVIRTPYLVPYRVRRDRVEVLRVLHGRQRWPDRA